MKIIMNNNFNVCICKKILQLLTIPKLLENLLERLFMILSQSTVQMNACFSNDVIKRNYVNNKNVHAFFG